jgi:hypothetical protein
MKSKELIISLLDVDGYNDVDLSLEHTGLQYPLKLVKGTNVGLLEFEDEAAFLQDVYNAFEMEDVMTYIEDLLNTDEPITKDNIKTLQDLIVNHKVNG